jgi:DNA-directed RNA polymerase beta subunit
MWLRSFLEAHGLTWDLQVAAYNHCVWNAVLKTPEDPRFWVRIADGCGGPDFCVEFGDAELEVGPKRAYVDPKTKELRVTRVSPRALLGAGQTATYSVPLTCTVRVRYGSFQKEMRKVHVGDIPVMVGSFLCNESYAGEEEESLMDQEASRGFFVVNGHARVVVSQKHKAYNRLVRSRRVVLGGGEDVTRVAGAEWSITITSWNPAAHAEAFEAESEFALEYSPKTGDVTIRHNSLHSAQLVTVSILMLALGKVWTVPEADALVREHPQLGVTMALWKDSDIRTPDQALNFVASRMPSVEGFSADSRKARVHDFLARKMLPHVRRGTPLSFVEHMLQELMKCVEAEKFGGDAAQKLVDDPDFLGDERVRGVGEMFADQFRAGFFRMTRDVHRAVQRCVGNAPAMHSQALSVHRLIHPGKVTHALVGWLSNGMMSVPRKAAVSGTVDRLNTKNRLASIAHMRMVTSQTASRSAAAKQLHESQTGFKCPYETPDGDRVGITTHLAVGCVKSLAPPAWLSDWLWDFFVNRCSRGNTRVEVDGDEFPPTLSVNAEDALRKLRAAQQKHAVPGDTCFEVSRSTGKLCVRTEAGRLVQALVRVEWCGSSATAPPLTDWGFLESCGAVEWVDAQKLWDSASPVIVVADSPLLASAEKGHTHAHLCGSAVLGVSASVMPYLDMNQAPRNTYGSGMQKQALAARPCPKWRRRFRKTEDVKAAAALAAQDNTPLSEFELYTPQRPLACTEFAREIGFVDFAPGQNALILVSGANGENQDDSCIVNRASLERGLFRSTRPQKVTCVVDLSKEDVDWSEVPLIGDFVKGGAVLVKKSSREDGRDTSYKLKLTESGFIESVRVAPESSKKAARALVFTFVVRKPHTVQLGDKLCVGPQKFTVSKIVGEEDMPFTVRDGTRADVVLNPHMIPTRMTGSTLYEMGAAKATCVLGFTCADATPFTGRRRDNDWAQALFEAGYEPDAKERFVNPHTGDLIEKPLCVGVAFLNVLGHFATKSFARGKGPVDSLTRQPVHGRDRQGGLKFGLMEYACLEARGCSALVQDRNVWNADPTLVGVCGGCGRFTWVESETGRPAACVWCARERLGQPRSAITKSTFRLLVSELRAMGISATAEA